MIYALDDVTPEIAEGAWVAPGAHVMGRVTVANDASIWFGAVLRGDTEPLTVGEGSNVQENTVVHADPGFACTIGANVTVGHKAMLHGCTIGDGSLIGMGATVLNGVIVGRGCLIGAGALLTEGKIIPDGSLVMGAPGKVVRELDAAAQAALLRSAEHYRANAARFRDGLRAL